MRGRAARRRGYIIQPRWPVDPDRDVIADYSAHYLFVATGGEYDVIGSDAWYAVLFC
jgi:hypothetical protein